MADIKLNQVSYGNVNYFDVSFTNGDFTLTQGLDTALTMSVFGEKRDININNSDNRGGWYGNAFSVNPGYEIGNINWRNYQSPNNLQAANLAEDALNDGLSWLIEDKIARAVNATVTNSTYGISAQIDILQNNNKAETQFFDLWQYTGK